MTQESQDLIQSLIHTTTQRIKVEREFLKDMEAIKKQFGWSWGNTCEGGDEIDQARAFGKIRKRGAGAWKIKNIQVKNK